MDVTSVEPSDELGEHFATLTFTIVVEYHYDNRLISRKTARLKNLGMFKEGAVLIGQIDSDMWRTLLSFVNTIMKRHNSGITGLMRGVIS
jgi:hypothetical protein